MGQQTLQELKDENAAAEAEGTITDEGLGDGKQGEEDQAGNSEEQGTQGESDASAAAAEDEGDEQAAAAEAAGAGDQAGDITADGADDDWMTSDSESGDEDGADPDDDDKQFGDSDMASVRRKYATKLKTTKEELEEAKAELEELKLSGSQQQGGLQKPTRDQFLDADDPDAEFQIALTQWTMQATEQQQAQIAHDNNVKAQRGKVQRETTEGVDAHYNRATELGKKSGISNDQYLKAEYTLRGAMAQVYKAQGIPEPQTVANNIADRMIAVIGEGSERVMYKLGVDAKLRSEFQRVIDENPDGLATIAFLSDLKSRLAPKTGRKSAAPKPAKHPAGDKTTNAEEKLMKKAYQDADKSGNLQARMNARRKARKAGYNPDSW